MGTFCRVILNRLMIVSTVGVFIIICLFNNPSGSAHPTTDQPILKQESGPQGADGPVYDPESELWYMPDASAVLEKSLPLSPTSTGGPDDFGYTWDDTVAFSWVDATIGGIDTGLSGSSFGKHTDPIPLPFPFKYYENTYATVTIAASGYIGFGDMTYWPTQFQIPSSDIPNNIIAPYATPLNLDTSGPMNRVYYKTSGGAPNRIIVVEWYQVHFDAQPGNIYTYELILHESGSITFNYQSMAVSGGHVCGSSGIEDSTGEGLSYLGYCEVPSTGKAVQFYRPVADYRVKMIPPKQSQLTHAGQWIDFRMAIKNTGGMGNDTFNLTSLSSWPVSFYSWDGTTLLTDTDYEGNPDTGVLIENSYRDIIARVHIPDTAIVGDDDCPVVTASSSIKMDHDDHAELCMAIPAPFAQILFDSLDFNMRINLVRPTYIAQGIVVTGNNNSSAPAIAETRNGFVIVWDEWRTIGSVGVKELHAILTDHLGITLGGKIKLTDYSGEIYSSIDSPPAIAVAPDGKIGILWTRGLYNSSQYNYNVYFAIIDDNGKLLSGPTKITNNDLYGTPITLNVPFYYSPSITATGDNRFILAWECEHEESGGDVSDIYYSIRSSSNNTIQGITQVTSDTPGWDTDYSTPTVTDLAGNRFLLAYNRSYYIDYAILNSDGSIILPISYAGLSGNYPRATELSTGKVLLIAPDPDFSMTSFVILDATTYSVAFGPADLIHDGDFGSTGKVALAADREGNASIVMYEFSSGKRAYYYMINSNGEVSVPAITLYSTTASMMVNSYGYSLTAYDWTPTFYLPLVVHK